MGATPADVVLVFGDIGQLQEVAEGADDSLGGVARQRIEQGCEFVAGRRVAVAGKTDGGLTDALDKFKNGVTFLLTNRVAKNSTQQADVVAKGFVFVVECVLLHCLVLSDQKYGGVGDAGDLFGRRAENEGGQTTTTMTADNDQVDIQLFGFFNHSFRDATVVGLQ